MGTSRLLTKATEAGEGLDQRHRLAPAPPTGLLPDLWDLPGLQRHDREVLDHGIETGIIRRLPHGEFIEVHQPLGAVDDHGHPLPVLYQGARVPQRMNQLGAGGHPVPGSLYRPDPQPKPPRFKLPATATVSAKSTAVEDQVVGVVGVPGVAPGRAPVPDGWDLGAGAVPVPGPVWALDPEGRCSRRAPIAMCWQSRGVPPAQSSSHGYPAPLRTKRDVLSLLHPR